MKRMMQHKLLALLLALTTSLAASAQTMRFYKDGELVRELKAAQADSLVFSILSTVTVDGHEAVDLGLPSGTLWATCNVGALQPDDCGSYLAWGETKQKSDYSWDTYTLRLDGGSTGSGSTGGSIGGGNVGGGGLRPPLLGEGSSADTTVSPSNATNDTAAPLSNTPADAAQTLWGGGWHVPSLSDFFELGCHCSWAWAQYGKSMGYIVVSETNGNYIFLPAAGYRDGASLYSADTHAFYWSNTLYESDALQAYILYFDSYYYGWSLWYERRMGLPIRPVIDRED